MSTVEMLEKENKELKEVVKILKQKYYTSNGQPKRSRLNIFISWVRGLLGLRCYILQKDVHISADSNRLHRASRFQKVHQTPCQNLCTCHKE